jgi:hypothetical protein
MRPWNRPVERSRDNEEFGHQANLSRYLHGLNELHSETFTLRVHVHSF